MPWPDFTELTFGMAFLREFEKDFVPGGKFPTAPEFISQTKEGTTEGGYDVEAALDSSTPVFLQFKRSFVVKRRYAKEFENPYFRNTPVYRMKLHPKNNYLQHRALRFHAFVNEHVFYVTSQVSDPIDLATAYQNNEVISSASALFSPLEIDLPNYTEPHWVSFYADDDFGFVFSETGKQFKREYSNSIEAFEKIRGLPLQDIDPRKMLNEFCRKVLADKNLHPRLRLLTSKLESPVIKASVLAYYHLDTLLTFVKHAPLQPLEDL